MLDEKLPGIRCTQTLLRRLGYSGSPNVNVATAVLSGASLGSWAAKVVRLDGRELVLALNERTCLTLVFPLTPRKNFRLHFAEALSNALGDLGVPRAMVQAECTVVEFQPLTRLNSGYLAERLNDVAYFCGIELCYHTDLSMVQRNLNELPHPQRDPCVPADAIRRLFHGSATAGPQKPH